MVTVRVPFPATLDAINGKSIVSFTRTATDVIFKNRVGTTVATLTIRLPDKTRFTKAIRRLSSFDSDSRDVLIKDWSPGYNSVANLTIPASPPTQAVDCVDWSPDGKYVAIHASAGPVLWWYKRDGDTFTKMADPVYNPTGGSGSLAWSPDGQYLAIGLSFATPYVVVYKRTGDTLTRIAVDPPSQPTTPGKVLVSWSPDGTMLIAATSNSPYLHVWSFVGGAFTKLTTPTAPGSYPWEGSWSPDGQIYVVAHQASPGVTSYKRVGNTLTKYNMFSGATPFLLAGLSCGWSPDGEYFIVVGSAASIGGELSNISMFKRDTGQLTVSRVVSVVPDLPTSSMDFMAWSPDSRYVIFGLNGGGGGIGTIQYMFRRVGDTLELVSQPTTTPAYGGAQSGAWSPDGKHLVVGLGGGGTPAYTAWYKSAMGPIDGLATRLPY